MNREHTDMAVERRAERIARTIEEEVEETVMLRAIGSTIANTVAPMAGMRATSRIVRQIREAIEARPDLPDAVWTLVWLPPNRAGVPGHVEICRVWTTRLRVRTFRTGCTLTDERGVLLNREEELMHHNPHLFPPAGKEAHLLNLLSSGHHHKWAELLVEGERLIDRAAREAEQAGYRLPKGLSV